jgi:Ca2+-binding RTX toxin-like protein
VLTNTNTEGQTWYLDNYGNIDNASVSGYSMFDSTSFSVAAAGESYSAYLSWGAPTTTANTQEVSATNTTYGLAVTRSAYVGTGFLRQVESLTNTGTTAKTFTVTLADDIYFDSSTRVAATSSGDGTYSSDDDWYMADSASFSYHGQKMVHVVSGGLKSPSSAGFIDQDTGKSTYSITLAAGETKTLMHFYGFAAEQAAAAKLANAMSSMDAAYLVGMSSTQLSTLANFTQNVTAASTTTLGGAYQMNLTLTGSTAINGTGNANDNVITGNSANNVLSGLNGNDTLVGGAGNDRLVGGEGNDRLDGGLGTDTMLGGAGNDVYVVDAATDVVTELANEGADTVNAGISYSIASLLNVENITLTGTAAISATGNVNANKLTGNSGNNSLSGGDGNDTLDGGAGTDVLNGGAGDDIYVVDTTKDSISDSAGIDEVDSSVSFSLAALGTLENLVLTGSAAINGTGNALANRITGNAAANLIDGGAGADTMIGGAGDDTYVVRDTSDRITETSTGGTDKVQSSVTHTLANYVENLQLIGSGVINGTGNSAANSLLGNSANNTLSGLAGNDTLEGGAGVDTLDGGSGNDLYKVDTTTDKIIDSSGTDTVQSTVSFSLAALTSIENLTLVGTGTMSGTGNNLDNLIEANVGNSVINGGSGNDTASYASALAGVTVTVNQASQSTGGSGIDSLTSIENLSGSGYADNLTGDSANNVLNGKAGNDTLNGGGGNDQLIGEAGNDRLVDMLGDDTMNGGAGDDTYVVAGSSGSIMIEDALGVDTLDASGAAGGVSIDLTPGSTSNIDGRMVTLAAGGVVDAPLDVLFLQDCSGSFGDDVASVKALVPQVGAALSSIQTDNRFGLASFIDKDSYVYRTDLALTSSQAALTSALGKLVIGDGGDTPEAQLEALLHAATHANEVGFRSGSFRTAIVMTDANYHVAGDTTYVANDGDAILELEDYPTIPLLKAKLVATGIVPIFAVTAGNEHYYNDLVEQLGFGTVVTLAANSSNLVTALTQGMTQITEARIENAIGTGYNDTLMGNSLANVLTGGAGNDTYLVQGEEDSVVELAGGGTDLVLSTGNFTLSSNVENLTLTGAAHIDGTGNTLNNQIVGNNGDNIINGGGGDDRMIGGRGNDIYVVDRAGDTVIEYAGNGADTVESSISYTLGTYVENLTLKGEAAIKGTGNALNNQITGNGASNVLTGGAGNDSFVFNTLLRSTNIDTITDFVHGADKIVLDDAIFSLGMYVPASGTALDPGRFQLGAAADSYFDRIIYNQATGALFYDADGYGGAAAIQIATIGSKPVLDASDFFVV